MASTNSGVPISRRHFLGLAGTLTGSAVLAPSLLPSALAATNMRPASADEALDKLMAGNARYARGETRERKFSKTRADLAMKQKPFAIVLSCADSRVAPELLFDQSRGDLFVVRVAGNFVNVDGLASIEYAVKFLDSSLIMVLGHSACGAVDAAIKTLQDHAQLPGHLPELIGAITPAVEAAKQQEGNLLNNSIKQNVKLNVEKLRNSPPIVSEYVAQRGVKVVGGLYDLETGKVGLLA